MTPTPGTPSIPHAKMRRVLLSAVVLAQTVALSSAASVEYVTDLPLFSALVRLSLASESR